VRRLCTVLAGEGWSGILANLPGYRPALGPGKVLVMTAALPWWRSVPRQRPDVRYRASAEG
jgi:hypothetical protein